MTLVLLFVLTILVTHLFEKSILATKMSYAFQLKAIALAKAETCLQDAENFVVHHQQTLGWQFQHGCFTIQKLFKTMCNASVYKILAIGNEGVVTVQLESRYILCEQPDQHCLDEKNIILGRQYWRNI